MTVEEIRQNKRLQSESALRESWGGRAAIAIHAIWSVAELLAEIRDVMRFEAGLDEFEAGLDEERR